MLTNDQKRQINEKVKQCLRTCEEQYGRKFLQPTINFNLRGTTAGKAWPVKWRLDFHPVLAAENWDDYIDNTVPHEVAHLVDYEVFQKRDPDLNTFRWSGRTRGTRQKRSIHGPTWKSVMHVLGADAARCHNYDTSQVARRKARHTYTCTCGHKYELGPKYHKNIQTGAKQYRCTKCKSRLTASMFGSKTPPVKPVTPPKKNETAAPRAPAAGSKLDGAVRIVRENANRDRGIVITRIMNELGMSYAGAQTYYYASRKYLGVA